MRLKKTGADMGLIAEKFRSIGELVDRHRKLDCSAAC